MKKSLILMAGCLTLTLLAGDVLGEKEENWGDHGKDNFQNNRNRGQFNGRHQGRQGHKSNPQKSITSIIGRIINNSEIADEIGLSEDQIETLKDGLYDVKKEQIKLKADLELSAMEQVRLMTEMPIDENAVIKEVEKTGEIRIRIAKLRLKPVFLIQKTLTKEQIEKIKELMKKHKNKRGRRKFKNNDGNSGAKDRMRKDFD